MSTSALNASSVPVPEGFQIIANGFIPEMGPTTGYHNQTLLLAIRLIVLMVVLELRKRTAQRKHQMDVTPLSVSILKLVLIAAAVLSFGLLLASYKGVPVVGLILGVLVAI